MDWLSGGFSFPFISSLSFRNTWGKEPVTHYWSVSCLASCPLGSGLSLLLQRFRRSPRCHGDASPVAITVVLRWRLLLCLQFPSSCFHQHFSGLNPALMNSIFSMLTAQCPSRHTFSDAMLCGPTQAVSLLLWYLLIIEMQHFELFLPSVFCIRLLLAFTWCVRSQEICIFPTGEAVVYPWDPANQLGVPVIPVWLGTWCNPCA